jgi:hypothetical protein
VWSAWWGVASRFDLVAWEGKCPLGTSDAGSQPTPQIGLSRPGWRPGEELTAPEERMVAGTAGGELVDCGKSPFDLAGVRAWGRERVARAEVSTSPPQAWAEIPGHANVSVVWAEIRCS